MIENLKKAILQTVIENIKGYILIAGVFLAGMALSYILNISSGAEEEIKLYLEDFVSTVKNHSTDSLKTFSIAMSGYVKLIFLFFLMALSAIGSVGVVGYIFIKGFSYGVVFTSVFSMMGAKAILLFFCLMFPHILVLIPSFGTYSLFCLKSSLSVSKGIKNLKQSIIMSLFYGVICVMFSGVASLIQAYLEPILIRVII